MKHYLQFLLALAFAGIFVKKLSWKGWVAVGFGVFAYIMYCWRQG